MRPDYTCVSTSARCCFKTQHSCNWAVLVIGCLFVEQNLIPYKGIKLPFLLQKILLPQTSELSSMDEEHLTGVPTNQISLGLDLGWLPPAAASAPPPTRASVPPTRPRVPQLARRSRPFIHHLPRYGTPFPSIDDLTAPEDAYRVGYPMHTMELYRREARRDTRRYGTTRCLLGRARYAEELV